MRQMNKIDYSIKLIQTCYNKFNGKIIATTSSGTTSALLIDLISKSNCNIPIVFIDTGFLFKETIQHYKKLKSLYPSSEFIKLYANNDKSKYISSEINDMVIDNNKCCFDNKIKLLNDFFERKKLNAGFLL